MLSGNFHDDDFDGLVLKIPSIIIQLNGLEPAIEQFYEALNKVNICMHMPDHRDNLYEIENFSQKKQLVAKKQQQDQEHIYEQENRYRKLVAGEIYELEWKTVSGDFFNNEIMFDDVTYNEEDYTTKKSNIKSDFFKKIKAYANTLETFKQLCNENTISHITRRLQNIDPTFIDLNFTLTLDNYGGLRMHCKMLHVKHSWRCLNGTYRYHCDVLQKLPDGTLAIGIDDKAKLLPGFEKRGFKLIKP